MDKDYLASRAAKAGTSSGAPRNAAEGLLHTVGDVTQGLFKGVTGVVTKPVSGAQRAGVEGFFKGIAEGAVGLVAKPIVGVADGLSSLTEGLKNQTDIGQEQASRAQQSSTHVVHTSLAQVSHESRTSPARTSCTHVVHTSLAQVSHKSRTSLAHEPILATCHTRHAFRHMSHWQGVGGG